MASTHFTTGTTITSEWLNDVNDAVYEGNITAEGVQYTPPFTGGVTETVEAKLAQTVSVKDFGAVGDGVTDDTAAIQTAITGLDKGILYFPAGTYKCNIVVGNNTRIVGEGREKTIFIAEDTTEPIISFESSNTTEYYFLGGQDFSVDGETTAEIGIRVGSTTGSDTYGTLDRVYVHECVDNIYLQDTVGFRFTDTYSYLATDNCLLIDTNDIVTVASFDNCQFRQGNRGLNLRGGSILSFSACIIEANKDIGMFVTRDSDSGARQIQLENCWFEGNGYAPTTSAVSTLYLDFNSGVNANYPVYFKATNTVFSSPVGVKDVYLNRGNIVDFDTCTFTALTSTYLYAETGTGQAYATLRNCGTITGKPSPTLYASFPEIDETAVPTRLQGFAYEYWYNGLRYTNHFPQSFYTRAIIDASPIVNVTGNGAIYTSADFAGASTTYELYDYGSVFASGQFTASAKGIYNFSASWPITNFSSIMSAATVYFIVNPAGSPTYYEAAYKKISSYGASDLETFNGSAQIRLGKGDVVVTAIKITGGAANSASVYRAGVAPGLYFFSGSKLA